MAAVGMWNLQLLLLRLPDLSTLQQEELGGDMIPRSILLTAFEGVPHCLCGLGDGQLYTWRLELGGGAGPGAAHGPQEGWGGAGGVRWLVRRAGGRADGRLVGWSGSWLVGWLVGEGLLRGRKKVGWASRMGSWLVGSVRGFTGCLVAWLGFTWVGTWLVG